MKLTRNQTKLHNKACSLLEKNVLSFDDKLFILENWQEGATNLNGLHGAFFTPYLLARDFRLEVVDGGSIIDLCAGIGALSLPVIEAAKYNGVDLNLICIELNQDYIEVGKKIIPEATWIKGDALDLKELEKLGRFDQAISNPPFGKIKTGTHLKQKYKGSEFEFKIIDIASNIADCGTFILPQMSTPYRYSGEQTFRELKAGEMPQKVKSFIKQTGLEYDFNTGIDTAIYINHWKGVSPVCEIVNFDFTEIKSQSNIAEPTKQILQLELF